MASSAEPEEAAPGKVDEKAPDGPAPPPPVSFWALWRYCNAVDCLLLLVGCAGSVGSGVQRPASSIVMGNLLNAFNTADVLRLVRLQCIYYTIIAAGGAACGFMQGWAFSLLAERLVTRLRVEYLAALLRTEVAYFDTAAQGALVSRLAADVALVHAAVGLKAGLFVQQVCTFFAGIIIGFVKGWELTLIMLAVVPLLIGSAAVTSRAAAAATSRQEVVDAHASAIMAELFGAIRTVAAFTGEQRAFRAYDEVATTADKLGGFAKLAQKSGFGMTMCTVFGMYALVLWYGTVLIRRSQMTGGSVMTVFFSVMMGGSSLGQLSPSVDAFARGRGAAAAMYALIDRKPLVDASGSDGDILLLPKGDLRLDAVSFRYVTRPEVPVFAGLTLEMRAGESTALVGESGSGKSTVISLLLRFYEPEAGCVRFDGADVRTLQLRWLRARMALVSQEPVLFAASVRENLLYGSPDASQAELEAACKSAQAHNFIMRMADGYGTHVGDRGMQLSGGQKQRMAIARAILRDPVVLLLDEATSALDNASERAVQEALAAVRAAKSRTTVTVAHRLSTIEDADAIVVMRAGVIVERGTHDELRVKPDGAYAALLALQASRPVRAADASAADVSAAALVQTVVEVKTTVAADDSATAAAPAGPVDPQWSRIADLCWPELPFVLLGTCSALIAGCNFPVFALLLSRLLTVFFSPVSEIAAAATLWCGLFMALGAATLVSNTALAVSSSRIGSRVGLRLRGLGLRAALRQEVSYFDLPSNATGALAARLASDAQALRLLISDAVFAMVQNFATLTCGLAIAFTGGWQLALVMIGTMPLTMASYAISAKRLGKLAGDTRQLYERSTQIASDSVGNIRTVAAFGSEERVLGAFKQALQEPARAAAVAARVSGYTQGFSQAMAALPAAFAFYVGGIFISKGIMTFQGVMQVFFALLMSSIGMSQAASASADIGAAKPAASSFWNLIDRKSAIDPCDEAGLQPTAVQGALLLRDVCFEYPLRPGQRVLHGVTLPVAAGTTVALIGASGSGKSTIISLLLRYYDPTSGAVFLDGADIRQLQLRWLRTRFALVAQEATLFGCSVADNIAYGADGATRKQVEAAAAVAHADGFIAKLPEGYETLVGERGVQLSGGQRQRIAIARAVIRDPAVLLLDEATSALDSTSERAVQAALASLQAGRTCVVVAHRLSTIRDANVIAVMSAGEIVEQGSHDELASKRDGAYASLLAMRGGNHE